MRAADVSCADRVAVDVERDAGPLANAPAVAREPIRAWWAPDVSGDIAVTSKCSLPRKL